MRMMRLSGGLVVALLLSVAGLATLTFAFVTATATADTVTQTETGTGAYRVSRFAGTPGFAGGQIQPQQQSPQTVVALALTATAAAGGAPPPTIPAATVTAIAGRVATASSGIMAPILSGARPPGIATTDGSTGTPVPPTVPAVPAPPTAIPMPTPLADVASAYAQVSPAVVMISNPAQRQPQSHAAGIASGTIYEAQGYIVTVADVVRGASDGQNVAQVDVQLADGKLVTGKVIGRDDATNLAVVKIDASAVPAAITLMDTTRVTIGTPVIAIGAPLQFAASVTRGIVSGINRAVGGQSGLIQSSVSASSGMHGGPLVDASGNVIGINTFNLHDDDATYRVSLAIPSGTVKSVTAALAQFGSVSRPSIGATIETLTPTRAVALGLNVTAGAYISAVVKGGPADTAGLVPGDIITAVNSTALTTTAPLNTAMSALMPKQSVTLTVNRAGATKQLSVTLG